MKSEMKEVDRIRTHIFELCDMYVSSLEGQKFSPGETYIPVSGKVVDSADVKQMVDAALDMWLTAGRFAEAFERRIADYTGHKHARLTVSGSAANLLAFTCLTSWKLGERRILPGSEVITVAAGFPTTVAPIVQNGCAPVFVDVDLETANVDVDRLAAAVGPKTRAVMIAHTLGNPFDLAAVKKICDEHGLYLIEDCCDALGASFGGKPVGTFGDLATLSFYPAHHITMGEGGAVLADRKSLITLVESFRDWGRDCWCPPGYDNTCGKRFSQKMGGLPRGYDHKLLTHWLQHEGFRHASGSRSEPDRQGGRLYRQQARELEGPYGRLYGSGYGGVLSPAKANPGLRSQLVWLLNDNS